MNDLDFNQILPLACKWAEEQEQRIISNGKVLSEQLISDANMVGVSEPTQVRILLVDVIPLPEDPILQYACEKTHLISKSTAGLTLRHGIFIRSDCKHDRRLHVHELAHVAQYERLGGVQQFLQQYLYEVMNIGYPEAPMEQEAINAEKIIDQN